MTVEKCSATRKRDGQRCGRYPKRGLNVCVMHGAGSPRSKAAAARRVAEAKVERQVQRLVPAAADLTPVSNPVEVLARLAAEADAWRNALAEKVNELAHLRFTDNRGSEQLNALVSTYERALDRTARICESLARLDLDDRLVQLHEAQARALLVVLGRALGVVPAVQRREIVSTVISGLQDAGLVDAETVK